MKKYVLTAIISLGLCVNFLPKVLATNISEDYKISFIDRDGITVVKNQYIEIEGERCRLGESIVSSFRNTEEGRACLSINVSENLRSSILNFWDFSDSSAQLSTKNVKLLNSKSQEEATVTEHRQIYSLSRDNAKFLVIKRVTIGGVTYSLGDPKMVSYENSLEGRQSLSEEISEPFYSLVITVWGDAPTVISEEQKSSASEIINTPATDKIESTVVKKVEDLVK